MAAYLIVRATVPESDRTAFDDWYQNEHLPDAKQAFDANSAFRGWLDESAGTHVAHYEFDSLSRAQEIIESDALKAMVTEFDRVWEGRVTRVRELIEIKQQI
jgi:hypothetical protein